MPTFDIVIVNWNSGNQLKECIKSIQSAEFTNCVLNKVIIVDNDSKDNSIELVRELNFDKLEIIQNKENLGFGKACNIGAKLAQEDFILFLNPDTKVYKDTFQKLFNIIKNNHDTNIAVYGIQLIGDDGKVQRTCARFPTAKHFIIRSLGLNKLNPRLFPSYTMEDWDHKETRETNHVIGAFFLLKRHLFERLNGFDERFFVYIEDLDFSKRAHGLGYKAIYITESKAYHKGGGTSEKVKDKRLFYLLRSQIIYSYKHFNLLTATFVLFLTVFIEPVSRIIFLTLKGSFTEIKEVLKAYKMLYSDMLNILRVVKSLKTVEDNK